MNVKRPPHPFRDRPCGGRKGVGAGLPFLSCSVEMGALDPVPMLGSLPSVSRMEQEPQLPPSSQGKGESGCVCLLSFFFSLFFFCHIGRNETAGSHPILYV